MSIRTGFNKALSLLKESPSIVEIGTIRSREVQNDGHSTLIFAEYIRDHGGNLFSIDNLIEHLEVCKSVLTKKNLMSDRVHLINMDGIMYIRELSDYIDLLYLDGFDYVEGAEVLSATFHLDCGILANPIIPSGGMILIDDVLDETTYKGKGEMLIPYLIKEKYEIIEKGYQFLLRKP